MVLCFSLKCLKQLDSHRTSNTPQLFFLFQNKKNKIKDKEAVLFIVIIIITIIIIISIIIIIIIIFAMNPPLFSLLPLLPFFPLPPASSTENTFVLSFLIQLCGMKSDSGRMGGEWGLVRWGRGRECDRGWGV